MNDGKLNGKCLGNGLDDDSMVVDVELSFARSEGLEDETMVTSQDKESLLVDEKGDETMVDVQIKGMSLEGPPLIEMDVEKDGKSHENLVQVTVGCQPLTPNATPSVPFPLLVSSQPPTPNPVVSIHLPVLVASPPSTPLQDPISLKAPMELHRSSHIIFAEEKQNRNLIGSPYRSRRKPTMRKAEINLSVSSLFFLLQNSES